MSTKLPILKPVGARSGEPWYADGLTFTCTQCGNCCTGGPGYVWVSDVEIDRLAKHLGLSRRETIKRYCREVGGRISLAERRRPNGNFDCIFLEEREVAGCSRAESGELPAGKAVPLKKRVCTIYPVRPLQCRTWPFWPENLESPERWNQAAQRCYGMNHGDRAFPRERVEALRDATDWPDDPPTSAGG